ncbi:hypothetical protein [Ferirhizobium litorale]|uniref:Uncharacterized protein n=1 Tax=Ferirhizobium litorale TaxID=2927786 RepID=A0AAE3U1U4_9HYPH|nr:hypothetical protein [Fererhizobium litorale]MDI7923409.1 hypothetical protein [Fererhizobium litorale]
MAITFPFDLLDGFPGWSTEFDQLRREEQSRTAGGVTYVKDMGSPLWQAAYTTRSLRINELDNWRARLAILDGGQNTFKAYPLSRCYPVRYPNGSWPTGEDFDGHTATVGSLGSSGKELTIEGLPAGFVVSPGDMIRIGTRNLHQVVAGATADGSGTAALVEVRPHFWPGTSVADLVSVKKPYCLMTIVPGSISSGADLQTGRGTISFRAIEAR